MPAGQQGQQRGGGWGWLAHSCSLAKAMRAGGGHTCQPGVLSTRRGGTATPPSTALGWQTPGAAAGPEGSRTPGEAGQHRLRQQQRQQQQRQRQQQQQQRQQQWLLKHRQHKALLAWPKLAEQTLL